MRKQSFPCLLPFRLEGRVKFYLLNSNSSVSLYLYGTNSLTWFNELYFKFVFLLTGKEVIDGSYTGSSGIYPWISG